jgi:predicted transcriptional regulator
MWSDEKKEYQGGYMAVLHRLAKVEYGPNSIINAKGRVFLYVKHRILRNWKKEKPTGKAEIVKATGLSKKTIKRFLNELIKEGHLSARSEKVDGVWKKTFYTLGEKFYGSDYIYNGIRRPIETETKTKTKMTHPKTYPHGTASQGRGVGTTGVPTLGTTGYPTWGPQGTPPLDTEPLSPNPDRRSISEPSSADLLVTYAINPFLCINDQHEKTESGKGDTYVSKGGIGNGNLEKMPKAIPTPEEVAIEKARQFKALQDHEKGQNVQH